MPNPKSSSGFVSNDFAAMRGLGVRTADIRLPKEIVLPAEPNQKPLPKTILAKHPENVRLRKMRFRPETTECGPSPARPGKDIDKTRLRVLVS
jgi:hypothetical protein